MRTPLPCLLPPPGCLEDPCCYSPQPRGRGWGPGGRSVLAAPSSDLLFFPCDVVFKVSHLPAPPPPSFKSDPRVSLGPTWKAAVTG